MGARAGQRRVILTCRTAKAAAKWLSEYTAPEPTALGGGNPLERERKARKLSAILAKAASRKRATKNFVIPIDVELIEVFTHAGLVYSPGIGTFYNLPRLVTKARRSFERASRAKRGRKQLTKKQLANNLSPETTRDERHRKRLKKRARHDAAFEEWYRAVAERGETILTTKVPYPKDLT
jgi:hypothetical protein